MAIDASVMYQRHPDEHRLEPQEYKEIYGVATLTRSVDDSKLLNLRGGPMIIISAKRHADRRPCPAPPAGIRPRSQERRDTAAIRRREPHGAALAEGVKYLRIYGEDVPYP
ncbi:hypothetical protein [Arthrobacter sp. Soil736]|uniref:hypothetical protein n=1 Tax=Arthrobacter sp. Soil736 TaxID=1736395 RepID=UPI003211F75F